MSTGAVIGIDLGTTNSLVAVLEGGAPRVLPNALGELLTPSAVAVDGGRLVVGAAALARATTAPASVARWFKRDMGTDRAIELGELTFRAEQLSALVLRQLKEDAEVALGTPVREAVVTVPAYFGELQRRATRTAAELAGLHVERIINEPTAAALAYGLHQRDREFSAVVLDLGGGTFDVTVLEVMEGVVEIRSSAGDARLGGEDFADALAALLSARVADAHSAAPAPGVGEARLRAAAERLKRDLSGRDRARLALPDLELADGGRADVEIELARAEAELAFVPLLARLELPIARALRDASVDARSIDEVLLVGGATRMSCVRSLAARLFGKLPQQHLPPDEAVAFGAAVQAGLKAGDAALGDLVVTDVAPFSMGIEVSSAAHGRQVSGMFSPILERGTVLPASRVETYVTASDGQSQIDVKVYQGEHALCRQNTLLGQYLLKGIPPKPAGEEPVEVRFTYDLNGLLEVEMTISSSKKTGVLVIEPGQGRMSQKQIEQARKQMKSLKLHPRDALPNLTALARADALYVELSGAEREELGAFIARFRAALETQDRRVIDEARATLIHLVSARRGG